MNTFTESEMNEILQKAERLARTRMTESDHDALIMGAAEMIVSISEIDPGDASRVPDVVVKALIEAFRFGYACAAGDALAGKIV